MLGLREEPGLRLGSRYTMGERESLRRRVNLEGSGPCEERDIRRSVPSEDLSTGLDTEDSLACGSYTD